MLCLTLSASIRTLWGGTRSGASQWAGRSSGPVSMVSIKLRCKDTYHASPCSMPKCEYYTNHKTLIHIKRNAISEPLFFVFLSLSRALYINLVCLWAISICSVFCGLCLYSFYKNCDPWTARKVSALDQVQTTTIHLKCNKNNCACACY